MTVSTVTAPLRAPTQIPDTPMTVRCGICSWAHVALAPAALKAAKEHREQHGVAPVDRRRDRDWLAGTLAGRTVGEAWVPEHLRVPRTAPRTDGHATAPTQPPLNSSLTEREKAPGGTLVPPQARPGWTPARSVSERNRSKVNVTLALARRAEGWGWQRIGTEQGVTAGAVIYQMRKHGHYPAQVTA